MLVPEVSRNLDFRTTCKVSKPSKSFGTHVCHNNYTADGNLMVNQVVVLFISYMHQTTGHSSSTRPFSALGTRNEVSTGLPSRRTYLQLDCI